MKKKNTNLLISVIEYVIFSWMCVLGNGKLKIVLVGIYMECEPSLDDWMRRILLFLLYVKRQRISWKTKEFLRKFFLSKLLLGLRKWLAFLLL